MTQDHNGSAIKIYDARTGGGFPAETTPEKCEAADECHGPGVEAPALPPDRTSSYLGTGVKPKAKHKKHQEEAPQDETPHEETPHEEEGEAREQEQRQAAQAGRQPWLRRA